MRSLTLILLLTLCGSAAAQKSEDSKNLKLLASRAGVKSVVEAQAGPMPAAAPLKVFLIAPSQSDVRDSFKKSVEEWNRTEAEKYGRVELAFDATSADVILARLYTPFKRKQHAPPPGEELWTLRGEADARGRPRNPASQTASQKPAPTGDYSAKVYSYIVAREAGGLRLLWRADDKAYASREEFGLASPMGLKDSESAGDNLRDQFFKMLKARGERSRD
jgi:hypothetical protein